jgi:hypothetical protein
MCLDSPQPTKREVFTEQERTLAALVIRAAQGMEGQLGVLEVRLHPTKPPQVFRVRRVELLR